MYRQQQRIDPVDRGYRRIAIRRWLIAGLLVYFAALGIYWGVIAEVPVDYSDDEEHFLYGSIGADSDGGIPYWIWRVLPEMFPQHLPDPAAYRALSEEQRSRFGGYRQFGFLVEDGRPTPIGFSQRRDLVMRVGFNCSVCHVSTLAVTDELESAQVYGQRTRIISSEREGVPDRILVIGMPANTVNLQAYFQFLFDCAGDPGFTTSNVMAFVESRTRLGPLEKIFYRRAIPPVRDMLLLRSAQLDYLDQVPEFGPGRVDTFGPYKTIQFAFPYDGTIGTADFPSIWNQEPREGMQLHWDGNNTSVFERNISASIGAGATPVSLDLPRMLRVARWIGAPRPRHAPDGTPGLGEWDRDDVHVLRNPPYPFPVDERLAESGRLYYEQHCAECHDLDGTQVGQVMNIDQIGTDPHRLDSYTEALSLNQNTLGAGTWWRFRNFRKTDGYANMPLDGIWARAPYLHNGSVPTLRDLLNPPERRPEAFLRGDDRYDPDDVGFRSEMQPGVEARSADGRPLFLFDTTRPGNGSGGHEYGVELTPEQQDALLEYLKTL